MAPKKKSINAFFVYMLETKQSLANQGIKMSMSDMPKYCQQEWEQMPDNIKNEYKTKAKNMKNGNLDKYTSIGEKIEEVKKESESCSVFADTMYHYIEELVHIKDPRYFFPKQKFIFMHINSYSCESDDFYFPAEISLAEFSLEKGIMRNIHELLGFNKTKTFAPVASVGDINNHAKNNHRIDIFGTGYLPTDYTAIFLRLISFIIGYEVDEEEFNKPNFDLPPVYSVHNSKGISLLKTFCSMYQLYKTAVRNPMDKTEFGNIVKVYHLDKLFMEVKNLAHSLVNPHSDEKALPSVALASDSLAKDLTNTISSVCCNFHKHFDQLPVCSNYYVCKWIYILSTHCCHYFNIKLQPGFHYDFNLFNMDIPIQNITHDIDNVKISNSYIPNVKNNNAVTDKFPALGGSSTVVQQSMWGKQNKSAIQSHISSNSNSNFPPLNNIQKTITEKPIVNSKGQNTGCKENSVVSVGNKSRKQSKRRNQVKK